MINVDIVGQLLPNPITMIVQLCCTCVLFLVVKKFLWTSVVSMLDKRSEAMQSELAAAQASRTEAEAYSAEAKEKLKEAAATSQQIVAQAMEEGKAVKNEIIANAKKEAEDKITSARREIEFEKNQMKNEMVEEMISVAMAATEKLIAEKSGSEDDQAAIERFVKDTSERYEPAK